MQVSTKNYTIVTSELFLAQRENSKKQKAKKRNSQLSIVTSRNTSTVNSIYINAFLL